MTVVKKEDNELIPTRTITGWRMCIDYRRLNDATRKYHFPLPFIDLMLEKVVGHGCYYFLDVYSDYNQIPIAPEDVEKTTFTLPSSIFAYMRMPFGLCNSLATFQRCMMSIFSYLNRKCLEIFMDDFTLFGDDFEDCLKNLELVLERCETTHLILNREKWHFMVKEGIVRGHKVTAHGIEVDRAKVDVIARLPPPTFVKSIRSFLRHGGFYRRFIKNFSSITKPLTALIAKDVEFVFTVECLRAFELIKEKLVSAPIMVTSDLSQTFEIMCDTSDVVVGAVLGQRKDKMFRPIYYASRTLNDDQVNYTTTEKEFFVVVFAFDKCVPEGEMASILYHCHDRAAGGHYGGNRIATKVMGAGFYWPTLYKDARAYVAACDMCQREGNISKRDEMPLNSILTVSASRKDWSVKLDEALWACRTAFEMTVGTSPFKLLYGKSCNLPVEIEHKVYWAIKMLNLDLSLAGEHMLVQMNELEKFRLDTYKNARIYKEKTKRWHDRLIKTKEFHEGDKVLLYNSRLRLFPEKFKSRWIGLYVVKHVSPYDAIEIQDKEGNEGFKVQCLAVLENVLTQVPPRLPLVAVEENLAGSAFTDQKKLLRHKRMAENIIIDKVIGESGSSNSNATAQSQSVQSTLRRQRKKRSPEWDHFDQIIDSEGNQKGVCKHCKREYFADTKVNGTKSLLTHMTNCKKIPLDVAQSQSKLAFQPVPGGNKGDIAVVP
ncbi:uncharacterized protein LOC142163813 [Nicotiana tabacum]|uniref:Uncharacterized protein LOC142163813 n=1 Tax=Nicotiana tabacum TaxID=4097 RepID=A0AC58RWE4_TOBAC